VRETPVVALDAIPLLALVERQVDEVFGLGHGCENCHHKDGREDCSKFPFHFLPPGCWFAKLGLGFSSRQLKRTDSF